MVLFGILQKLAELSTKIQRIEIMMSILEAKVGTVEIVIDLPQGILIQVSPWLEPAGIPVYLIQTSPLNSLTR